MFLCSRVHLVRAPGCEVHVPIVKLQLDVSGRVGHVPANSAALTTNSTFMIHHDQLRSVVGRASVDMAPVVMSFVTG